MRESNHTIYLFLIGGLCIYGFTLPLSKSFSTIVMVAVYAAALGICGFNPQFRTRVRKSLRQPLNFSIGVYVGVLCLGLVHSQDLGEGISVVKQACNLFFAYLMVAVLLDTETDHEKRSFFAQTALFSFLMGILILDFVAFLTYGGAVGNRQYMLPVTPLKMHHIWFGNLNAIGLLGAASLLCSSAPRTKPIQRAALWLLMLSSLASMLLSTSRTAWVGSLCSGSVFLYLIVNRKRLLFASLLFLFVACVSIYMVSDIVQVRIDQIYNDTALFLSGNPNTSLGARFTMWRASLSMFSTNPVWGVGTGDYKSQISTFVASGLYPHVLGQYNQPHNMYLFALATNGIIGLLSLLFIFYAILRHGRHFTPSPKGEKIFGLLALSVATHYLVAGLTESLLNIHLLICAFALTMGIAVRKQENAADARAIRMKNHTPGGVISAGDFRSRPERVKILHIVVTLPVGGVENTITRIIEGYQPGEYYPIICCIREGGWLAQSLIKKGYELIVLNRMKSRRFDFLAIKALYQIIRSKQIRIVRTHQYHANLYGRIAAMMARVPCIVASVHNVYTRDRKLHRRMMNFMLALGTDRIVAVSQAVKDDIMKYDKISSDKITVIYNGIPLHEFHTPLSTEKAREIMHLPSKITLIGSVGRLVQQKGHRYLIEAVQNMKDCCVVIAGDGPARKDLEGHSVKLNVTTIFLGSIEPKTVPIFLRAIDVFCFPSVWEGFGIALVEAMAAGLPIVASDIAPHREVLADAGVYAPPRDAAKLAQTLTNITQSPALRESLSQRAQDLERGGDIVCHREGQVLYLNP